MGKFGADNASVLTLYGASSNASMSKSSAIFAFVVFLPPNRPCFVVVSFTVHQICLSLFLFCIAPVCLREISQRMRFIHETKHFSKTTLCFFSLLNTEKIPLKRCFLPYFSAMQSHRQWNWYDKIESKRFNFVFKILKAHFFSNHNQMEHVL